MGAKDIQQEAAGPALRQVGTTEIHVGEYDARRVREGAMDVHDAVKAVAQGKRRSSVDLRRSAIDILRRRLEVEIEVGGDQLDTIHCAKQADEVAVQVIGSASF